MNYVKEAFTDMYEEIHFDYFYFTHLWRYIMDEPLKEDDDEMEGISYGKSIEQIARDTVTVVRFLLATGDFVIRKDLVDEKFSRFPAILETEEDMKLLEDAYIKLQNGDKAFDHFEVLYEIALINNDAKVPDFIPDDVAAVFQHV